MKGLIDMKCVSRVLLEPFHLHDGFMMSSQTSIQTDSHKDCVSLVQGWSQSISLLTQFPQSFTV